MKTKSIFRRISSCTHHRVLSLRFILFLVLAIAVGGFAPCAAAATDKQQITPSPQSKNRVAPSNGVDLSISKIEQQSETLQLDDFSIQEAASEEDGYLLDAKTMSWPYRLLKKADRDALLKFMMQYNTFNLTFSGDKVTPKVCTGLLSRLTSNEVKILEPAETQATINPKAKQTKCKNLKSLRYFTPVNGNPFDLISSHVFSELSEQEKIAKADTFYKPTANGEYYDFSKFFGENIWGFLGEGLVRFYNARYPGLRQKYTNYQHRADWGSLGAVYNSDTCEVDYYPQPILAQRAVANKEDNLHSDLPSFSAYVVIDEKLFLLVVRSMTAWTELALLTSGKASIQLALTEVLSPKKELKQYQYVSADTNLQTCAYQSY